VAARDQHGTGIGTRHRARDPEPSARNDPAAEGRVAERMFLFVVGAVAAAEIVALVAWLAR
jgi:hypothetical protein